MAWIDYQKAFDGLPHSWIIKSLDIIGLILKLYHLRKRLWATGEHVCVYTQKIS
jgi:hypothetical protein